MTLSENVSVWLFVSAWTVACQAPLSTEFSRQEYWNGFPFPSPGDHPNLGIAIESPTLQSNSLPSESSEKPKWGKDEINFIYIFQSCLLKILIEM